MLIVSKKARYRAHQRDIEETVNDPFCEVWRVTKSRFTPDGFSFLSVPMTFHEALDMIRDLGGDARLFREYLR